MSEFAHANPELHRWDPEAAFRARETTAQLAADICGATAVTAFFADLTQLPAGCYQDEHAVAPHLLQGEESLAIDINALRQPPAMPLSTMISVEGVTAAELYAHQQAVMDPRQYALAS